MSIAPLPRLAPILAAVGLLAGGACALSAVVLAVAHQAGHLHLVINLALALLPLGFALLMAWFDLRGRPGWALAAAVPWLMFLPNSPYLFTDFIHLQHTPSAWAWTYLLLLVWHSFAGLAAGLLSLRLVHHHLEARGPGALAWGVVLGAAALSGFGVALGRFERWHSVDLLRHPRGVVNDVLRHLPFGGTPFDASVVAGLGLFVMAAYGFFRVLTPGPETARASWQEDPGSTHPDATARTNAALASAPAVSQGRPARRRNDPAPDHDQRALTS